MRFKVGDRVKYAQYDNCTITQGNLHYNNVTLYTVSCPNSSGAVSLIVEEGELELVQPEEKVMTKFKVGDRVKWSLTGSAIGTVIEVNPVNDYPFKIRWDDRFSNTYRAEALELVQPKTPKEPVPGKWYNAAGVKCLYIGKGIANLYVYQYEGAHIWTSIAPYTDEWVDKVTLPAMEINCYAVVQNIDGTYTKRGAILLFSNEKDVEEVRSGLDKDEEIIGLIGILPEKEIEA